MSKDIKTIDKNFDITFEQPKDLKWYSFNEHVFSLHGIFYSESENKFRRMPKNVADAVSEGVSVLSTNTAGGRIRFITNSPYIALRVEEPFGQPFSHMTVAGKCGFTLYANNNYAGTVMPSYEEIRTADTSIGGNGTVVFSGIKYCSGEGCKVYSAEIFFPLYSDVSNVYIGLKGDCILEKATEYKYKLPITFYGCFGEAEHGECGTVDDCHPNSLGFLRMYQKLLPLTEKLLKADKK